MSFLTAGHALRERPRVVLDSNVWIDILVFDDPAARPIAAALAAGALDAVIDARCLAELTRVLDYPQFERFAVDKAAALAQVARWTELVAPPPEVLTSETAPSEAPSSAAPSPAASSSGPSPAQTPLPEAPSSVVRASGTQSRSGPHTPPVLRPLPKCRDRDDQKFLELAQRAEAAWLVSKDRELLRMAKRIARDFGFSIGLPAAFSAACLPPPA
jgi:predicted nucleic acid-binding protein